jgi:endonuclease-8
MVFYLESRKQNVEGPPVRIVAEELAVFKGKIVKLASGNARIEKEAVEGQKIEDVFSRGKNLFIRFLDLSFRIHFLMFGSYRINEEKKGAKPRLSLVFQRGMLNFYNCSVKILNNDYLGQLYDEEIDITSENWNFDKVLKLSMEMKDELICDVLLDQSVFAGVGNIIKNEALFMANLHPLSVVGKIPEEKLREAIVKTRQFSMLFYRVRKKGRVLNPHLRIYRKRKCDKCKGKVENKRTGKRRRISFFCPSCQVLYA